MSHGHRKSYQRIKKLMKIIDKNNTSEADMFKNSFRHGDFHPVRIHNKVSDGSKIYYRNEVVKYNFMKSKWERMSLNWYVESGGKRPITAIKKSNQSILEREFKLTKIL